MRSLQQWGSLPAWKRKRLKTDANLVHFSPIGWHYAVKHFQELEPHQKEPVESIDELAKKLFAGSHCEVSP